MAVPVMTPRLARDQYYLKMLELVSARSTCGRRAVGAIITDVDGHILSTGYNGVPRGVLHCTDLPCLGRHDPRGDSTRCLSVHAEINALLQCSRLDLARVIYVSCTPCFSCAKAICNTEIKRIICCELYADQQGAELLASSGITVEVYPTS